MILKLTEIDLPMTLVDASRKRCEFLEAMTSHLDLDSPVLQQRAEDLVSEDGFVPFDVVTTKAVASVRECLERFGPLVRPGGRMITFKGPRWDDELQEARRAGLLSEAGFTAESAIRIPWVEAHLVSLYRHL